MEDSCREHPFGNQPLVILMDLAECAPLGPARWVHRFQIAHTIVTGVPLDDLELGNATGQLIYFRER